MSAPLQEQWKGLAAILAERSDDVNRTSDENADLMRDAHVALLKAAELAALLDDCLIYDHKGWHVSDANAIRLAAALRTTEGASHA